MFTHVSALPIPCRRVDMLEEAIQQLVVLNLFGVIVHLHLILLQIHTKLFTMKPGLFFPQYCIAETEQNGLHTTQNVLS